MSFSSEAPQGFLIFCTYFSTVAKTNKSLVVIPTYNESMNIENTIEKVLKTPNLDILVVDDGSPDGTGEIADNLAKINQRVNVMHRKEKSGLGTAYKKGFIWGIDKGYENLIEMDCDGSHPADQLPTMLNLLESNELVIGSRYIPGGKTENWPLSRRALSKGANIYANLLLRGKVKDSTSGFRGLKRFRALEFLDSNVEAKGFAFQIGMTNFANQSKWKIKEFPITFIERLDGESKINTIIKIEAFFLILKWAVSSLL